MRKTTKLVAAVGASALVVGSAGIAYAYWTSTGAGDGTASTKTPVAAQLSVDSYTSPTNMAPGVTAGAITVTVKNNDTSNTKAQQALVTISSVDKAIGAVPGTCDATDYTLSAATMTTGALDLAPSGTTTFSGATLGFNNKLTNQDQCKGATVNLHFALS